MAITIVQQPPNLDAASLIAAAGFVQALSPELQLDVSNHLAEGDLVFSIQDGEQTVGFAIFGLEESLLYLGGIILLPEIARRGVAAEVVQLAKEQTGARYLALRTQSLRMWVAASRMTARWFPNRETLDADHDLAKLRDQVCYKLGMAQPIVQGFYGGPLYGEKPSHHDISLQLWWDSICCYERGDAVLCIGELR